MNVVFRGGKRGWLDVEKVVTLEEQGPITAITMLDKEEYYVEEEYDCFLQRFLQTKMQLAYVGNVISSIEEIKK